MLITGSTYRSIASQNILSYSINGNIDSTTGISSFGLSGDSGSFNLFTFSTGKIYDVNNRHVWSYNPSENFAISGNINTGDHHYYINDNLICLSTPKPDHYYKYFYANSQNSVMDLDINIIGNNYPNYSISFPFTYTIGDNITGYISNNSDNSNFSFQFFTGQIIGQPYYSLLSLDNNFVSGVQSVELILNYTSTLDPNSPNSGAGELEPLLGNLSFNTNFGNVIYNLNIPINKRPYYFADFIEIFTGVIQQDSFFNYNYVYELRTKSPTDQDVYISLISRSGHLKELYTGAFSATGTISNTLNGFIYGDDYITGSLTGTVVSIFPNYYGNLITGFTTSFESVQQSATGLINYYYNVPVPGGSALGTAPPGTVIEATGYLDNFTGTSFIYGSRSITGAKTGTLSGYWFQHLQTGTGMINLTGGSVDYFTGVSSIDNIHFNWDSIPYIGYDIENYNSNYNYKIYGITGSGNYTFISSDSGVLTTGITTQQSTGELINYIFRLGSSAISNISGEIFGSENPDDLRYVFGENSSVQWGTSPDISTGFLGFQFKNFSPNDSGIIRHYELKLDRNFFNYKFTPSVFKLQGSNNNTSWQDMDTRSGINFYRSQTNIFPVTGTGLYNYVRLLITSGQLLQHVNQNDLDATDFGLSVNKIYFYEKTVSGSVTGLYKNFIDNNVTGNYFYSSFNTGVEPDYLFSNDDGADLSFVTNLDDTSTEITGGYIGYKTAYVYSGNVITGFYVSFEQGYTPQKLVIDASTGINYRRFYEKTVTSNIESGLFLTGIVITGATGYNYFRFNFTGDSGPETVRVKKINLYTSRQKDFFDLNPITITGFGNKNILTSGFGTGFLTNPTGEIFFPAVSYETGLLTGLITDGGSYTWNDIFISSTGRPNNVFVDRVTGFRNAIGGIIFNTGLLSNEDYITINDVQFNYITGVSDSNYNFNNIYQLINVFNSGVTGGLDDTLRDVVGVSGYIGTKIISGLSSGDFFGTSMAINRDNNVIVMGGPFNEINSLFTGGAGAIYVSNSLNKWDFSQRITGVSQTGRYGTSVALNNDASIIVMGGPGNNQGLGGIAIYTGNINNGWRLRQSIGGYYQAVGGYAAWGNSVCIDSGNKILVGGYRWGIGDSGAIISYTGNPVNGWAINSSTFIAAIPSQIPPRTLDFGFSVAISEDGNRFMVGAPEFANTSNTVVSSGFGYVYVYTGNSSNVQILTGQSGNNSSFGYSLATNRDGSIIVVGAPFYTRNAGSNNISGMVSIYTGSSNSSISRWELKQTIAAPSTGSFFGSSVSINNSGDIIGIGASGINSIFIYTGNSINGWQLNSNLRDQQNNRLGYSIAVGDNTVVGGAPFDNTFSNRAGAGILYEFYNNLKMILFSINPSGEDGNSKKLTRYASNLDAIQIPNRYLLGGQTFRPLSNTWEGNFEETFDFTVENSGIYTIQSQENISTNISGIVYENNFYPNWSGYVTLISEGNVLNTGLTVSLSPGLGYGNLDSKIGTNSNNANLGSKVFIKDNFILASQPNGAFTSSGPGPVIIYSGDNRILGPNLTGNWGTNSSSFGESITTSNRDGSIILVGGPLDNAGTGSILVYKRNISNTWNLFTKLTGIMDNNPLGPFGPTFSRYGTSITITSGNDVITMGSPFNNNGSGSVIIYTGDINGWRLKTEIIGTAVNFFGQSLSTNRDASVIVVGCPAYLGNGNVNVYTGNKNSTWSLAQIITGVNDGRYGYNVQINDNADTIAIAGPNDYVGGGILIYTGNQTNLWKFSQKITESDIPEFGSILAINSGDILVAGSTNSNQLSIYQKNQNNVWNFKQKFTNENTFSDVSINNSGDTLVVGIPGLDSNIYTNVGGIFILKSGYLLSGQFAMKSGLSYLGYSGLNIEFNKYVYDNSKTTVDLAEYSVTSDRFTFTGIIRG